MSQYLEALEISAFDARSMFKLLDRDNSNAIDIEEFCDGCIRLKGEAKSFDVNCLMYENQRVILSIMTVLEQLEGHMHEVHERLGTINDCVMPGGSVSGSVFTPAFDDGKLSKPMADL
eukprot:TRINITY_DN11794_c0_g2_i1.p1 TRINITY_DN11794_c0_g2~~TRINITY_DN11794_c0_g2_i1.p1  ORF type:complete len:118 (+),score=20.56 TRINITY_DN11794_c0_g2_i1:191-544(+)